MNTLTKEEQWIEETLGLLVEWEKTLQLKKAKLEKLRKEEELINRRIEVIKSY